MSPETSIVTNDKESVSLFSVNFPFVVLNMINNIKKKLVKIKNGDHSLSNKKSLKCIIKELDKIVSNII